MKGHVPRMFPGGLRVAEDEEEAAVEAVRDVIRSKRLFRFYGVAPSLRRSKARELESFSSIAIRIVATPSSSSTTSSSRGSGSEGGCRHIA